MKRLLGLILLAVFGFLLGACTKENDKFTTGSSDEKTIELEVMVPGMGATGTVSRSAKTDPEKEIKTMYVLQFTGVDATATLAKHQQVTPDADNKISFPFKLIDGSGNNRVYIVANVALSVTQDVTTLEDFEKTFVPTTVSVDVPTTGIPMYDVKDFDPMSQAKAPDFKLCALVAKVTLNCSIDPSVANLFSTTHPPVITLKQTASGTTYSSPADITTAYHPTGVTFNAPISLGAVGSYTYYMPENIAGQNSSVNRWIHRSVANAPANAVYFEITGYAADGSSKIMIALFPGDPVIAGDFNTCRNFHYAITANILGIDTVDQRLILHGDFMYVNDTPAWEGVDKTDDFGDYLDLNADLGHKYANCYIITDNVPRKYVFDATKRGNDATSVAGINYATLPDLATATEARVIWQTGSATSVISTVQLNSGKVSFATGVGTEGNAVIGVFASSDPTAECLWSWHIWRVDGTAPGDVDCIKIPSPASASASFRMMDRNLGAYNNTEGSVTSTGLLYQWGRKDPFPGVRALNSSSEVTNIYGSWNRGDATGSWNGAYTLPSVTVTVGGTEAWAVKYPATFITNSDNSNGNWLNPANGALWGSNVPGAKTIYDPCPVGYRVPRVDTWTKQANPVWRNRGIVLKGIGVSTDIWHPLPGYRNHGAGTLANAGATGTYWTTGPGQFMLIDGGVLNTGGFSRRAAGCSIRCVSENENNKK